MSINSRNPIMYIDNIGEPQEVWTVVTGKRIYEAIEADGFGIIREEYFESDYQGNIKACLLGMAGLNLRAQTTMGIGSLEYELNKYSHPETGNGIANHIVAKFDEKVEPDWNHLDDVYVEAYDNALRERNIWGDYFTDVRFESDKQRDEVEAIAQKAKDDALNAFAEKYPNWNEEDGEIWYVLDTWEEALAMAKEALSHVWDEKFTLRSYDYENEYNIKLPSLDELKEAKSIPMFE